MGAFSSPVLLGPLVVTSRFGAREPFRSAPHNGVDLRAPVGTPLFAPGDGRVTQADTVANDAGGLELIVRLDNGYQVGFAHLSQIVVAAGQRVAKGELLGATGASGTHGTGPHLHLTLRDPSGVRIDPQPHLIGRGRVVVVVLALGAAAWAAWRRWR